MRSQELVSGTLVRGGIIVVINDHEVFGFLHGGSLLLSDDGKTHTFKRVKQ